MSAWRGVVGHETIPNRGGGWRGGTRIETLTCGHKWIGRASVKLAQMRRCDDCPYEPGNLGPTAGVPKKRKA